MALWLLLSTAMERGDMESSALSCALGEMTRGECTAISNRRVSSFSRARWENTEIQIGFI